MFPGWDSFWCGTLLWESGEHHFREVAKLAPSALPESKIGEMHCQTVIAGNLPLDIHKTPSPSGISQIKWEYWVFSVRFVWNWSRTGFTSSGGCIKSIIAMFFFLLPSNPRCLEGSGKLVTYTECLLMATRKESGLSNKHAPNFQLIGSLGSNSSSDYCAAVMERNSRVICKSSH